MLNWADQFNICCFLDNHQYHSAHHSMECLLAAGSLKTIKANAGNAFASLDEFLQSADRDWLFGHLGYDLKNELESLNSAHPDGIAFPDLFFYVPEVVAQLTKTSLIIGVTGESHEAIFHSIGTMVTDRDNRNNAINIGARFSQQEYIAAVERLKKHILRGDCYEINFCQEFFSENAVIHPLELYRSLSVSSPNPFSAYYKLEDKYLVCMSPERYLKRSGNHIISQPIKGTAKRDHDNPFRDELNKNRKRKSRKYHGRRPGEE
ncbi:MAG: chorismate-binding protein [Flavitalea sp.]